MKQSTATLWKAALLISATALITTGTYAQCSPASTSPVYEKNCRHDTTTYNWDEHPADVIARLSNTGGDPGDKDFFNQNRKRSLFVNGKKNKKGGFMATHGWGGSPPTNHTTNPNEWGVDFAVDIDEDCEYEREDILLNWCVNNGIDEIILYNISDLLQIGTDTVLSVDSSHSQITQLYTPIDSFPNAMGEIETFEWHLARFIHKAKDSFGLEVVIVIPGNPGLSGLANKFYAFNWEFSGSLEDFPLIGLCDSEMMFPEFTSGKKGGSTAGHEFEGPAYRTYNTEHLLLPKDDQGRISEVDKMAIDLYNLTVFNYRWLNGYIASSNSPVSVCNTFLPPSTNCDKVYDAVIFEFEWWNNINGGNSDPNFHPESRLHALNELQHYARCLTNLVECEADVYTVAHRFHHGDWVNTYYTEQQRANMIDRAFDRIYLYSYHKNPCDCYNGRSSASYNKFWHKAKLLRDNPHGALSGETEIYPVFSGEYYDSVEFYAPETYPEAGCDTSAASCNFCNDYSGRFLNDLQDSTSLPTRMGYVENIFQDQYDFDSVNTAPHPDYGQNHINGYAWFKSMMVREHGYSGKRNTSAADGDPPPEEKERMNKVYPNPARDVLFIEAADKRSKIRVYSAEGALLKELLGNTRQLNMGHYPAGLYFIAVVAPDRTAETFKIVKP